MRMACHQSRKYCTSLLMQPCRLVTQVWHPSDCLMVVCSENLKLHCAGHVRQSRRVRKQATPAVAQLQQSRKQKRRAEKAETTRLFADTKQEKRILKDKESIGDPRADAQGSQKIQDA